MHRSLGFLFECDRDRVSPVHGTSHPRQCACVLHSRVAGCSAERAVLFKRRFSRMS